MGEGSSIRGKGLFLQYDTLVGILPIMSIYIHHYTNSLNHFNRYFWNISLPWASLPAIERWPQGSLVCALGGSLREKQKSKEGEEEEEEGKTKTKP